MIIKGGEEIHRPCLYTSCQVSMDDKGAMDLLKEAGIPFLLLGPEAEIKTPYLEYGRYHQWLWFGLKEIKLFIKRWQNNSLPSFEIQ